MSDRLKRVTIKDVADEAGVSITTVSFVANGRNLRYVSASNQERVRKIIEELGYRANPDAIAVRTKTRVTQLDIAKDVGVSKATVSHALADGDTRRWMSQETRKKVREAAERLGYVPNAAAQRLRRQGIVHGTGNP